MLKLSLSCVNGLSLIILRLLLLSLVGRPAPYSSRPRPRLALSPSQRAVADSAAGTAAAVVAPPATTVVPAAEPAVYSAAAAASLVARRSPGAATPTPTTSAATTTVVAAIVVVLLVALVLVFLVLVGLVRCLLVTATPRPDLSFAIFARPSVLVPVAVASLAPDPISS